MSCLLELSNLTVTRGGRTLLSGLGCSINAGDVVVVLGPNGAGKSSLLLALAGLIPADGSIELLGRPLSTYDRKELSRSIAWQGELPPTEFGLTVRQRLELAAGEAGGEIETSAAAMDVVSLLQRPLGELSSGERQRTELAALILRDAPVWLLDEPTSHLDLKHQIHCIHIMKEQRAKGRAIVTVLHDLQQAMAIADHLILIDGRGGAEYGEAKQLFTGKRLSHLFDATVIKQGSVLVPDYGEK
ncbi:MAG: iron dicitrate ABC transporter ATP-binding protein [Zetaproteobacteria bacterium CG12_big_fil_rev_8_21_14_0_65_55_1124]|nr:MAG: iron dicitrate ABC transporter ATP-binding protein [Zetaproteobacteria bacterium CG1_02_55_237]PIS19670.1 MAG: iron dicitrate ABC transporter ATP-binding protein [Zetaproteobacteria bacterium CG08_land_8_20_14_0_20_55_17]PIW42968.1 MAG: iron dicitrate ABC transporter ATP-binding protein [Zetaproteobacteria bacterium CG12_big_fil_rev_8_21_14_0_65_55_1124]PIY54271.1 MAG: iron dicitrate ABC transporter ATP-binding protein [Zetaproteobacteria bacterium CG_4_10_14_0_8_um_filter_55_43]PIZ4031